MALVSAGRAQQAPTFRARADLVELDVSVLDKDHRPVRGLTRADFQITEDGAPQDVAIFEAVDAPDPIPPPAAWMRDVTPDVTTNETRPTRLWVLAIDDALIPQDPFIIKSTRKVVQDIIDKFGPEDLVSIVFTADSRQAQDFTNDRAKLLATLDKFNPGNACWGHCGGNQDEQFWLGSINTLLNVMDALVTIPNNRKAMIWVTPGTPVNVFDKTSSTQIRAKDLTSDMYAMAKRANVPIYPVDPCGLLGLKLYATNGNLAAPDAPTAPWVLAGDYMQAAAANTGGRAIVNTNDAASEIHTIFEENKSYYLLGYHPTNSKADGTLRRIKVKVNRADVEIRTRDSYIAPKPDAKSGSDASKGANATLATATASIVPVRDLPLRATVAPFAIPGGRNAAVAIVLGVTQPVPEGAARGRLSLTTELRTTAFTTEGDNKGTQRHTAKVTLREGATGDANYEALSRIDLPPGRYRLRIAAYHADAAKAGTVLVDVVVPDFGRDKVSMSGVVLAAIPGLASAPRDLLKDVLPIVPTAQRSFTSAERATAVFDLYQSTTSVVPARVAIRIVDDTGATKIEDTQQLAVDRFGTAGSDSTSRPGAPVRPATGDPFANKGLRAAEFQYALPLSRLVPGRYLLTFEATMGTTTLRRDVQFVVLSQGHESRVLSPGS
ncbi:MAG TPA: VWA domain-containing protein [Vicinamibacterales bacterium]|nr:VWA domain-containing protein [Vicinamibacterales bacterium]